MNYLNQIVEILDVMESAGKRVGPYRRQFPVWISTVFNYGSNWAAVDSPISEHALDVLDNLIEAMGQFVPALETDRFEELKIYLTTVRDTLNEDSTISRATRKGALVLVENILTLIDSYTVVGDFELERALRSLLGSLLYAAAESSKRDKWNEAVRNFFIPYSVNQAPGLDLPSVQDLAQLMQGG